MWRGSSCRGESSFQLLSLVPCTRLLLAAGKDLLLLLSKFLAAAAADEEEEGEEEEEEGTRKSRVVTTVGFVESLCALQFGSFSVSGVSCPSEQEIPKQRESF